MFLPVRKQWTSIRNKKEMTDSFKFLEVDKAISEKSICFHDCAYRDLRLKMDALF